MKFLVKRFDRAVIYLCNANDYITQKSTGFNMTCSWTQIN